MGQMMLSTYDLRNTTIVSSKSVKAARERIERIFGLLNLEKTRIEEMVLKSSKKFRKLEVLFIRTAQVTEQ
jgi:hypothetical protein